MRYTLDRKLEALRRRAWRMATIHGLSLALAALLSLTIALGVVDYLFRFQDRGVRMIASLAALVMLGWVLHRRFRVLQSLRVGNVDLAGRIERRFPHLKGRLLSGVEFLRALPSDPAAGSPALLSAVISQAEEEAEQIDFSAVLDRRPMARAIMALMAAALIAGAFLLTDPLSSRIAVARLLNPLGNAAWPRMTHLTVRQAVERVARGSDFRIVVVDAHDGRLPAEVRIHYRFADGDGVVVETERLQEVDDVMVAERHNVLRAFSYRVEGGDDQSMPWRDVEVVEPPVVESVSLRLIPPAYTGWPTVASPRHIRALVGTQIEAVGRASRPLRSAVLQRSGATEAPARLDDTGRTFRVAWPVEKSGAYGFTLTDRDGLQSSSKDDRWEIDAIADAPPTVNIEEPAATLFVTSQAVVPLRIAAKDDLALSRIALQFRRADGQPEETAPLWNAPLGRVARTSPPGTALERQPSGDGDRHVVDYPWRLAPLDLKPGMHLTFRAMAGDYRPQTGMSEPRGLSIISVEELQDRIADREKLILGELERALRIERGCRDQIVATLARLAKTPQVLQSEVDQLQSFAQNQRDVDQVLTSRGEGLPMHILALLADLRNNRVVGGDIRQRTSALLTELDRLKQDYLSVIERELTTAVKTARVELDRRDRPMPAQTASTAVAVSLAAAGKSQDAVIASLAALVGRQTQWDNYRRFAREIGQLLREQTDVGQRTAEAGRRTLTQDLRELQPKDLAALNLLGDRQLEVARSLDRLLQEMDQAGDELRQNDPAAAQTVAAALAEARQLGISGQMRATGQQIRQNQIGRAVASHKQIDGDLQAVVKLLAARSDQPTGDLSAPALSADAPSSPDDKGALRPGSGKQAPPDPATASAGPGMASIEQARRPDPEEVQAMMRQLWGELPERARQRLLQSPPEHFPPAYQRQIEDYFRQLADEKGKP
jgi:hypothetical protein